MKKSLLRDTLFRNVSDEDIRQTNGIEKIDNSDTKRIGELSVDREYVQLKNKTFKDFAVFVKANTMRF